nr:MAG: hypothetical protein TU35_01640 [Thermoproteus sp. AZ2]
MSIKPKFGEEILSGFKRYELRRVAAGLIEPGDVVYLYFTRPIAAVVGWFEAGVVYIAPPANLREVAAALGDIGLGDEDWRYVEGAKYAMLIEVKRRARCGRPLPLGELGLRAPPSYARLRPAAARELARLC